MSLSVDAQPVAPWPLGAHNGGRPAAGSWSVGPRCSGPGWGHAGAQTQHRRACPISSRTECGQDVCA